MHSTKYDQLLNDQHTFRPVPQRVARSPAHRQRNAPRFAATLAIGINARVPGPPNEVMHTITKLHYSFKTNGQCVCVCVLARSCGWPYAHMFSHVATCPVSIHLHTLNSTERRVA